MPAAVSAQRAAWPASAAVHLRTRTPQRQWVGTLRTQRTPPTDSLVTSSVSCATCRRQGHSIISETGTHMGRKRNGPDTKAGRQGLVAVQAALNSTTCCAPPQVARAQPWPPASATEPYLLRLLGAGVASQGVSCTSSKAPGWGAGCRAQQLVLQGLGETAHCRERHGDRASVGAIKGGARGRGGVEQGSKGEQGEEEALQTVHRGQLLPSCPSRLADCACAAGHLA